MSLIYRAIRHLNHMTEEDRKRAMVNRYDIAPSFRTGYGVQFYGEGVIVIGKNGHIGDHSTIYSAPSTGVYIGHNVAISHNVRMYSGSRTVKGAERYGNITIGNDVWIGVNAYIGPDVRIGDRAVIGANSVVTRNVPANAVFKPLMTAMNEGA